jgi:inositol transport system ATP-binding protein
MTSISPSTMAAVRRSGAVPNAEFLLAAEGIRKEFPGVLALDDVRFGSSAALSMR